MLHHYKRDHWGSGQRARNYRWLGCQGGLGPRQPAAQSGVTGVQRPAPDAESPGTQRRGEAPGQKDSRRPRGVPCVAAERRRRWRGGGEHAGSQSRKLGNLIQDGWRRLVKGTSANVGCVVALAGSGPGMPVPCPSSRSWL
eukprot:1131876-Rhodomonas_salina.1